MKNYYNILLCLFISIRLIAQTPLNCTAYTNTGTTTSSAGTSLDPTCDVAIPGLNTTYPNWDVPWTGFDCTGQITSTVVGPPVTCLTIGYTAVNANQGDVDMGTISTDTGGNLTITAVNAAVNGNVIGPFNCGTPPVNPSAWYYGAVSVTVCSDIPFSQVIMTNTGCNSGWVANCADQNVILDVILGEYAIKCGSTNHSSLLWTTLRERNNSHFTIYDSKDGINFNVFAEIPGSGSSSTPISYQFGLGILKNNQYFKICQTDFNGDQKCFDVLTSPQCATTSEYHVYIDKNHELHASGKPTQELTLFNAIGEIVKQSTTNKSIPTADLPNGTYFLQITNYKGDKTYEKILINH